MTTLSESQLAILSTIAYLDRPLADRDRSTSLGDLAAHYLENPARISDGNAGMSRAEWEDTLRLVRNDPDLNHLLVVGSTSAQENQNNGLFAYHFRDPDGGGDVVAFRGSEGDDVDWGDNFFIAWSGEEGTRQQQAALAYIESLGIPDLTVTGHSKGGNNAEFVALMSDLAQRCVSFSAPGFSQNFIDANKSAVSLNSDKITAISVDTDYITVLLQPVAGTRKYLEYGEFGPWAHAPNRLWDADGILRPEGRQYVFVENLGDFSRMITTLIPKDVSPYLVDYVLDLVWRGDLARWDRIIQNPTIALLVSVAGLCGVAVAWMVYEVETVARKVIEDLEWLLAATTQFLFTVNGKMAVFLAWLDTNAGRIRQVVGEFLDRLRNAVQSIRRVAGNTLGALVVDTGHLRLIARNLRGVEARISRVDRGLSRMLALVEPDKKFPVQLLSWAVGYDFALARCISHLETAARQLDACEIGLKGRARSLGP